MQNNKMRKTDKGRTNKHQNFLIWKNLNMEEKPMGPSSIKKFTNNN